LPWLTKLVHIIFGFLQILDDGVCMKLLLSNAAVRLRHQHQFVPRDLIFLDRLGNNSLRVTIGINVCSIPLVESVFGFQQGEIRAQTVLTPRS
jgi:hypothetical protein